MSRFLPDLQSGASPPEYAIDAQKVNIIKIDLSVARDKARINIGGSLVWVVDASDNFAECDFFFREEQTDGIPLRLGSKISGVRFSRSAISNAAQPGQWVKILYAADRGEFLGIENPWQKADKVFPASFGKRSFVGGFRQIGVVDNAFYALFNPAASSVNVILESFYVSKDVAAGELRIRLHNAGLANAGNEGNRFLGEAASVAQVSHEDFAGVYGTFVGSIGYASAGGNLAYCNTNFIVPPGNSFIIMDTGGGNSAVQFYWREVDIA